MTTIPKSKNDYHIACSKCQLYTLVDRKTHNCTCNNCGEKIWPKELSDKQAFVLSYLEHEIEKLKKDILSIKEENLMLKQQLVNK